MSYIKDPQIKMKEFMYNAIVAMITDQKNLDNLLRRHSIVAEDGFFLVSYCYVKNKKLDTSDPHIGKILKKGEKIYKKISTDQQILSFLEKIIAADPFGENLPVWYQFFLSRKFRGNSGKFFTPKTIARAMATILPIKAGDVVMDPTCGGGTFLLEVSKIWKDSNLNLIGNDLDESLVELSTLLLLIGSPGRHKKTFTNSDIYDSNGLAKWKGKINHILANPPFSLPVKQVASKSNLFQLGYKTSDAIFIDICRELLTDGGYLVCLLPHSIIANSEYKILRETVEKDWDLIGVIGTPEGIFHLTAGTTARADIVVLRKKFRNNTESKTFFAFAPTIGIPLNNRTKNIEDNELQDIAERVHNMLIEK